MRVAIVIGVSSYSAGVGNLPACEADVRAVSTLLQFESRFDEVLVVRDPLSAAHVKKQISDFAVRHKSNQIEEALFYFSGHGDFVDGEFYYLLSDYDPRRRKQTSLENSELDQLLRSMSPQLTVKLIDACHSGITYIKDSSAFDLYLKSSGNVFQKCYFLYSSQAEQSSYQDSSTSFFTRSIVEAVLAHDESEMRYKDVIDYVSDTFSGNALQTPFFVTQADFTEPFCSVSASLKESLRTYLGSSSGVSSDSKGTGLVARVKADAARYCNEVESMDALDLLAKRVETTAVPSEMGELFDIAVTREHDVSGLPNISTIGNWLSKNKHTFFAVPTHRTVISKKKKPRVSSSLYAVSLWRHDDASYEIVDEPEDVVSGFSTSLELPYSYVRIRMSPRFPNLSASECVIVPLVSRTEIRVFYGWYRYRDVDWARTTRVGATKWITKSFPTRHVDEMKDAVTEMFVGFFGFVLGALNDSFGVPEIAQNPHGSE